MSNYPNGYDDDSTLPPVNDNLTELGADAINALRDAVIQIEMALGTNIAGVAPTLADRLGVFINPDGTPNTSIIYALGLVTLPISNSMIAPAAGIQESKLLLDYPTANLFNYIRDLAKDVNLALGWISVSGVKLEPHLIGALYRHDLAAIDVAEVSSQFLNNVFRVLRDNTNAYTLLNDMNTELLAHQWADGSPFGVIKNITTNDGSTYPSNYAHVASGIFLDTAGFAVIPQTAINEQLAWDYIDQNSLFLLGTRVQNLYANGISVNSRSSSLTTDGYGQPLVPPTPAIAYLRDTGNASSPFDDIAMGDDIVQFMPSPDGYAFDSQFALVRVGDIVRVNYANDGYFVEVAFVISEKKYIPGTGNLPATFIVRIAGKNIAYAPNAIARIDKPLFNNNKEGVLSISGVNSTNLPLGTMPSLIVANPRAAQCLGVGFSPDEFNETHYFLYLALYPTGNPLDGYTVLPAIDVTGNGGSTPGKYTLEGIVKSTNLAFRQAGFNYRFAAFKYQGQFGIMLADAYNNASFSVINGTVTQQGFYSQSLSQLNFPNNVIDLFPSAQTVTTGSTLSLPVSSITVASTAGFNNAGSISITTTANGIRAVAYTGISGNTFTGCSGGTGSVPAGSLVTEVILGITAPDPLGFGPYGAGVSSPVFMSSYGTFAAAVIPTVIWPPLRRNNFYVNGTEQEKLLAYENDGQVQDAFGDGYWFATVQSVNPGVSSVAVTYLVPLDLSTSGLKAGKTLVVQPTDGYNFGLVDYGRFIISNVTFTCCPPVQTEITVYDAVHGIGGSPYPVLAVGSKVGLYFNNDSVSFNNETATDFSIVSAQFKRHFEVYVDGNGDTFTHERARFNPNGGSGSSIPINAGFGSVLYSNSNFAFMDIYAISPTLRGYQFGDVNKINLFISSFNATTGQFTGFLNSFDGTNTLSQGPTTTGKVGEVTRFYDRGFTDYIDLIFQFVMPLPTFSGQYIDIQLFPSLELDQENMLLGTVEVSGTTVSEFQDLRQFGNTSEEQLTTSALDFIALPEKLLHFNGVLRGFGFINNDGGPQPPTQYDSAGVMSLDGGVALVSGKINYVNSEIFLVPALVEQFSSTNYPINYALCVNADGDLVTIVLTDYDPVLGTPNAPQRVVTVINVVSSTIYQVDSTTFSNLLNTRKDLTPLYIVSAVVTGAGTSAATTLTNIRDVRRYVNDSDSESPAVLTSDKSQGNFRSLAAALTWLKFNSVFQNTLQVKGAFVETGDPVTVDPGLNFPLTVEAGGSTASLTFPPAMTISNVTFDGMVLVFSNTLSASNCTFNNCNVTFVGASTLSFVDFNDCTTTFEAPSTWTNVVIDPSTINVGATITVTNFLSKDSTYNVTVTQGFALGNNVDFTNSTFNYTANPIGIGSYNTNDLVNASSGMMYANVSTTLSNLSITGCTFTNTLPDHFPFISFQLPQIYSTIQNVNISSNAFTSLVTSNDIRAVISFVGNTTTPVAGSNYPEIASLIHVVVDNNICNYDQMIMVTATKNGSGIISNPNTLLSTTDVRITGNVCGAIGFINSSGVIGDADNSVVVPGSGAGFVRNKKNQLIIRGNTCRFIGNLDSKGAYIPFYLNTGGIPAYPASSDLVQYVETYTGAVLISENAASWIQAGAWGTEPNAWSEGVIITRNRLTPSNPAYLTNFVDSFSTVSPPNVAILLRRDFSSTATSVLSSIDGNTITFELNGLVNGGGVLYFYEAGVVCYNNANVIGNTVTGGVVNNGPLIWLWGGPEGATHGPTINVQQNLLNRGGFTITGYVVAAQTLAANLVNITNNVFDSQYIDSSNTVFNDTATNIPPVWGYSRNTNQVAYMAVPWHNHIDAWPIPSGFNLTNVGPIGPNEDGGMTAWSFNSSSGSAWVTMRLGEFMPPNVHLLYLACGWFQTGSNPLTNGSTISMAIQDSLPTNFPQLPVLPTKAIYPITSIAGLHNSILDVADIVSDIPNLVSFQPPSGSITIGSGPTQITPAQFNTGTVLTFIDMSDASAQLYTGKNYEIFMYLYISTNSTTAYNILASQLVIRYAWQ